MVIVLFHLTSQNTDNFPMVFGSRLPGLVPQHCDSDKVFLWKFSYYRSVVT